MDIFRKKSRRCRECAYYDTIRAVGICNKVVIKLVNGVAVLEVREGSGIPEDVDFNTWKRLVCPKDFGCELWEERRNTSKYHKIYIKQSDTNK
jgi:hypothetical protein